jgi:two-component system cell cycle response regulator
MQFHTPHLGLPQLPFADHWARDPQTMIAAEPDLAMGGHDALQNITRVGVLDDDVVFIRFVERALSTVGIDVQPVTTFDLGEAVSVIAATSCDAVFVDIFMYEGVHGFACIERLRAEATTRHLPIVVTTGAHDLVAQRAQFLARHSCRVLLKPFSVDALLSTVSRPV